MNLTNNMRRGKLLNNQPTETEFIILCEKVYRCYNDYLNRSNKHNKNYEEFLLYNNINYNALFIE